MFSLPDLPYRPDSLEPYIDAQTMQIHHDKHHKSYVDNLNKLLPDKSESDLTSILQTSTDIQIQNNAGGHANHSFFWQIMSPNPSNPSSTLLSALDSTFGSLDKFKEVFTAKAMSVFGSGWAFLIKKPDGTLDLKRHSFQNSPLMQGNTPILGVDVWEHAYYLKYQNRRADYISAWWNVVNWTAVSGNFAPGQS